MWKVLIVDDDEDVLFTTKSTLLDVNVLGRELNLMTAKNSLEADAILQKHQDVAVILLDVVMEKTHSGLSLVSKIRNVYGMNLTRILMRTGQPGSVEESDVVNKYEIDDYIVKSQVSRSRIITAVITAVRAYNQLKKFDRVQKGMSQILECSNELGATEEIQDFCNISVKHAMALFGKDANCMMGFTGKTFGYGVVPLTIVAGSNAYSHYVTPIGVNEHLRIHPIPIPAILGETFKNKKAQKSGCSRSIYLSVSKEFEIALVIERSEDFDDTDEKLILYFTNLLHVSLSRLNLLKERMLESLMSMGILAHEFRTPISSMRMTKEFLLEQLRSGSINVKPCISVLENENQILDRMTAHIDASMRNVEVVINHKLELPIARENVGKIVSDVLRLNNMAFSKGGSIETSIEEECWSMVDRVSFENVISNLISNSVNALTSRSERLDGPQISISVAAQDDKVVVTVRDQGIGISAENIEKIFEPFYSSSKTPAHGLGLAMVKKSILAMQGTIECRSELHVGTVFRIMLQRV